MDSVSEFYFVLLRFPPLLLVLPAIFVLARLGLLFSERWLARIAFAAFWAAMLGPVVAVGHGMAIVPVGWALLFKSPSVALIPQPAVCWLLSFGVLMLLDHWLHAWIVRQCGSGDAGATQPTDLPTGSGH